MNFTRKLMQYFILISFLIVHNAFADDQKDITQLLQHLYSEDAKGLLCIKSGEDSGLDLQLLVISAKYLTRDFMKYYEPVCKGDLAYRRMDFRTGEFNAFSYEDSQAKFTNVNIETPKISGNKARIRTTYDFPDLSYKDYGNFTFFTLIKENGQWKIDDIELGGHDMDKYNEREDKSGMRPIKSLKRLIKKEMEIQNKKKKVE